MAQTIYVSLNNGNIITIANCTGDPLIVDDRTIRDGYYRDLFTGTSNDGLYFDGTFGDPAPGQPKSLEAPPFLNGGIVPKGDPTDFYATISQETTDPESRVQIPHFVVTASDEFAHEPLRQVIYDTTWYRFPTAQDGTTMYHDVRAIYVIGWGNVNPNL